MSSNKKPSGPWAATVTPLQDGEIDHSRLTGHMQWLTSSGCNGVVLFGSTGEAASFTVEERMRALEHVLETGIPADKIIVGTGCCALADTIRLSRQAVDSGCAGVMVIPPYFYKPVSHTGLVNVYSKLIDSIGSANLRVYLYHFPELSGVPISNELLQQLINDYPDQIAGVKDSTGNLQGTLGLINDFPGLDIFTGDDDLLWPVVKAGGAGSVTATANIIPGLLGEIWQALSNNSLNPPPAHELASTVWQLILNHYPITEALKICLAEMHGDAGWRAVREPLCTLPADKRTALLKDIENSGYTLPNS